MPLATEVGLGPCEIVLDSDPAPGSPATERGTAAPSTFRTMTIVVNVKRSPISATTELLFSTVLRGIHCV